MTSFAAIGFALSARAQQSAAITPATQDEEGITEIIVTAQRREQALSDVGMSINVQTGEQLRTLGVASTSDLNKIVPALNVVPANTGFNGTPLYTLRGVGFNERSLSALASISIYQDEVPLSYPYMTAGPLVDIARVEVLKGPQGTLYGQNSTGGAINYIANRPTDTVTAGVETSFSRFNRLDAEGYISGPLAETLKARFAVKRSVADGWQRSTTRDDELGAVSQWAGRFLLEWTPSDSLTVNLNLNGWVDRSETTASQIVSLNPSIIPFFTSGFYAYEVVQVAALDQSKNIRETDWTAGLDYRNRNSLRQGSLRVDWDLSDAMMLTSLSSFAKQKVKSPHDVDSLAAPIYSYVVQGEIETFNQEIRLTAEFADRATVIVGGNYSDDSIDSDAIDRNSGTSLGLALGQAFGIPETVWSGRTVAQTDRKAYAFFANLDYEITPQLTFTSGARYTKIELDYSGCTADSGNGAFAAFFGSIVAPFGVTPVGPGECVTVSLDSNGFPTGQALVTRSLDEDNIAWRGGLNYKPNDDLLIYGNVSRGYKSGDFPTVVAIFDTQLAPVVQERLTAYEVGLKASVGRQLQVNGAVFVYDYRDKQLYTNVQQPPPLSFLAEQTINIPESRINGAELELNWYPLKWLNLRAGVGYTDSEIREAPLQQAAISTNVYPFAPGFIVSAPVDVVGDSINLAPEWQANGDAQYDFAVGGRLTAFVGTSATYASSTLPTLGSQGPTEIDEHTIIDARVGVRDEDAGWQVSLWGRNIFDENYATSVIRNQDVSQRYVGMPATYGITFGYNWD